MGLLVVTGSSTHGVIPANAGIQGTSRAIVTTVSDPAMDPALLCWDDGLRAGFRRSPE